MVNLAKTKIVCTIGPACAEVGVLRDMIDAGMAVARLNFSHGSHADLLGYIAAIRQAAANCNRFVAIMGDLSGPKMRIGALQEESYALQAGDSLTITIDPVMGSATRVSTTYQHLPADVKPGDRILLDDGYIQLDVVATHDREVVCRVQNTAILKPHKGMNLPGVALSTPSITDKDLADIEFAVAQGLHYLAVSFVRSADDISLVRSKLHDAPVKVIAKIERPEALASIDAIINAADGVMVARGDLGVELPLECVPMEQKQIIRRCNHMQKIVITATQMLESMIEHPSPTRAEVSDVANAIIDGTDAIMLSAETSTGRYPVAAVQMMTRIALETERSLQHPANHEAEEMHGCWEKPDLAIAFSAADIASVLNVKEIVAFTKSGHTALLIAKQRPVVPILCLTPDINVAHQVMLLWGVRPMLIGAHHDLAELCRFVNNLVKENGLVQSGERLVLTMGLPFGESGMTNLLHVLTVG